MCYSTLYKLRTCQTKDNRYVWTMTILQQKSALGCPL